MDEIAQRRDELVTLASDLIGFDTTAREHNDDPARDEAALQKYLAARLRAAGAKADLWEPAPEDVAGSPMIPPGLGFDGRPQLSARFPGSGGGRSLLFNGHIDVVTVEPRDQWTSDPFRPEVRDGKLYGRGACDMKGGIAAMVFAAEMLAGLDSRLAGDLLVCTVTDEESTGAGGLAAVAHGVRANGGIVTESTDFEVQIACRGSLIPTITVPGRAGHAGVPQPHWRDGGGVNAIGKAAVVADALRRLETDWRLRSADHHPYLSPCDIVPVQIAGGEWMVSIPASCRLVYHIAYLPAQADASGWGGRVRDEVADWVRRASQADPWLARTRRRSCGRRRSPPPRWRPTNRSCRSSRPRPRRWAGADGFGRRTGGTTAPPLPWAGRPRSPSGRATAPPPPTSSTSLSRLRTWSPPPRPSRSARSASAAGREALNRHLGFRRVAGTGSSELRCRLETGQGSVVSWEKAPSRPRCCPRFRR
jgi:acetylornithine deacetylase